MMHAEMHNNDLEKMAEAGQHHVRDSSLNEYLEQQVDEEKEGVSTPASDNLNVTIAQGEANMNQANGFNVQESASQ